MLPLVFPLEALSTSEIYPRPSTFPFDLSVSFSRLAVFWIVDLTFPAALVLLQAAYP